MRRMLAALWAAMNKTEGDLPTPDTYTLYNLDGIER